MFAVMKIFSDILRKCPKKSAKMTGKLSLGTKHQDYYCPKGLLCRDLKKTMCVTCMMSVCPSPWPWDQTFDPVSQPGPRDYDLDRCPPVSVLDQKCDASRLINLFLVAQKKFKKVTKVRNFGFRIRKCVASGVVNLSWVIQTEQALRATCPAGVIQYRF